MPPPGSQDDYIIEHLFLSIEIGRAWDFLQKIHSMEIGYQVAQKGAFLVNRRDKMQLFAQPSRCYY
jgi:hypothetical protein